MQTFAYCVWIKHDLTFLQCFIFEGKFVNHKGRNRHFTSPEELEEERKSEESKKWRKKKTGDGSDEEESENEDESNSSEEEESESEDDKKKSGVHGLIEIENPNRVQKKAVLKVTDLDPNAGASSSSASAPAPPAELSRREREEIERQKKQANYQKLHAQGKTEQARADLARLAIIKQQREEAARQRELKKKETDAKAKGGK